MSNAIFQQKKQLFDRWAPSYDCLLTTIFYQANHKRLLEYLELPDSPKVLDLGCGTGKLLNRLATEFSTLQGVGLDLSTQMLNRAKQQNQYRDRLTYYQGNVESLPFAEEEFDAVFNTISFLHYPNPQTVLSQVSRVLKPEGRFYLVDYTVRDEFSVNFLPFFAGGKLRFYSPRQREEMGSIANLDCLNHYYLLGPVMLTLFSKSSTYQKDDQYSAHTR